MKNLYIKILILFLVFLFLYNLYNCFFSLKEGLEGSGESENNNSQENNQYMQNNEIMQNQQQSQYLDYDPKQNTPMVLAQKNQANIMALRDQIKGLSDIQQTINNLTSRVDQNEKNITVLTNAQTAQGKNIAERGKDKV